jgi:hypothetical protein
MGVIFGLCSLLILGFSFYQVVLCFFQPCNIIINLIDFVGYLIISLAIFDVGRYLWEEEVFRERELRSPKEARKSLTKFMVIIFIAVTMEALLSVIKANTTDLRLLIYPAALFLVAILILVGLGVYQRFSLLAEMGEIQEEKERKSGS